MKMMTMWERDLCLLSSFSFYFSCFLSPSLTLLRLAKVRKETRQIDVFILGIEWGENSSKEA